MTLQMIFLQSEMIILAKQQKLSKWRSGLIYLVSHLLDLDRKRRKQDVTERKRLTFAIAIFAEDSFTTEPQKASRGTK